MAAGFVACKLARLMAPRGHALGEDATPGRDLPPGSEKSTMAFKVRDFLSSRQKWQATQPIRKLADPRVYGALHAGGLTYLFSTPSRLVLVVLMQKPRKRAAY